MSNSTAINKNKQVNNFELVMLHEFALILNSTHNIDHILRKSASKIREIMQSDGCQILLTHKVRNSLKLKTAIFDGGKPLPDNIDETKGISGLTFEKKEIIIVTDSLNDPRVTKKMQEYFNHRSMVSVPIIVKDTVIGVILVYSKIPENYSLREGQFLMMLGNHLGLAVESANLIVELRKAAIVDPLTGAYNYRFFRHELESVLCENPGKPISLIMIDINNFKQINDSFGHLAGDYVLQAITTLIEQCIRGNDSVARYGGDEFAVILPFTKADEAMQVAKRIEEAVSNQGFDLDGTKIKVSVSWGAITTYKHRSINKTIDLADKKLYDMKKLNNIKKQNLTIF